MSEDVTPDVFREALCRFATGVTVVAAWSPCGPVGLTVTSFASVALDPPLILVCIGRRSGAHDGLVAADAFGVSVLDARQADVAEQFARRGVDRFRGVPLRPASVPLVDGALVSLECARRVEHVTGDHTILVGEVVRAAVGKEGEEGQPLVRFGRGFGGFVSRQAASSQRDGGADSRLAVGDPGDPRMGAAADPLTT